MNPGNYQRAGEQAKGEATDDRSTRGDKKAVAVSIDSHYAWARLVSIA